MIKCRRLILLILIDYIVFYLILMFIKLLNSTNTTRSFTQNELVLFLFLCYAGEIYCSYSMWEDTGEIYCHAGDAGERILCGRKFLNAGDSYPM